jgi:hypothetical protein
MRYSNRRHRSGFTLVELFVALLLPAIRAARRGFKHPRGVQLCSADGLVRFVADNINNIRYRTSCTRNGNEAVPGSF